jgi:TetR/AcrR family transcriptional regulator, cholesterol catabolism regulator
MDQQKGERPFGATALTVAPLPRLDGGGLGRGSSPLPRADERLSDILTAATSMFAREGYHKATMRQIAREAGVSLAGVYHYVERKEGLLFLIQFRAFSGLLTEVRSRLCGVKDPSEQLRVLIRTHLLYAARNMAALKVCSHELDSLTGQAHEQVRRVRREYYALARDIIDGLIRSRAPTAGLDARIATMSLFGALNWLYRWYDPARDRSPASLANQISAQFLAGILGAEPFMRRTPRPDPALATGSGPEASTTESRPEACTTTP